MKIENLRGIEESHTWSEKGKSATGVKNTNSKFNSKLHCKLQPNHHLQKSKGKASDKLDTSRTNERSEHKRAPTIQRSKISNGKRTINNSRRVQDMILKLPSKSPVVSLRRRVTRTYTNTNMQLNHIYDRKHPSLSMRILNQDQKSD